jgi:DNA-binding transcriptional LysR family regulator
MEATTTDLIVRMVTAGLGVAIIPVLPNGIVTRGQSVVVRKLAETIRPIDSGLLIRRGERLNEPSQQFISFIKQEVRRRGWTSSSE